MSDEPTLYDRIGGERTIHNLIDNFYDRVLDDDELAGFFAHTSMEKLRHMQKEFFAAALDGPVEYGGSELAVVHQGRGITRHHFTRFVDHLIETLQSIGVSEHDIDEIIPRIALYVNPITGQYGEDG